MGFRPPFELAEAVTDLTLTFLWLAVLAAGLGATVLARRLGLSATHARDLLHVGAGVWVVGWPWWDGVVAPLAIVGAAAMGVALVPAAATRFEPVDRFRRAVSDDDEVFDGLVVYTAAFAALTWLGLAGSQWFGLATGPLPAGAFPAAAGLLALSLGDGLGGLFGRRFGRLHFALPWGKRKSVEGSLGVAVFTAMGVALAGAWFGVTVEAWQIAVLGAVAAGTEAVAPRGTDNALVPVAVWGAALLL